MDDNSGLPVCPFFRKEHNGKIYCEGAVLKFPDRIARRKIAYGFCASMEDYQNCMIHQTLTDYYNRKYNERKG